jgi:hypothetical protein
LSKSGCACTTWSKVLQPGATNLTLTGLQQTTPALDHYQHGPAQLQWWVGSALGVKGAELLGTCRHHPYLMRLKLNVQASKPESMAWLR